MEQSGTKEKIFLAAVALFAEKGFEATTVRDICRRAGAANLNAVQYYFGGKSGLYDTILEAMAAEGGKRMQAAKDQMDQLATPEEKLRRFIFGYMRMLYDAGQLGRQFCRIYIRELADPSPCWYDAIQRHTEPQTREVMEIIRELLGRDAPYDVTRDSLALIVGQITYYAFSWPIYSRMYPDPLPLEADWQRLAENICVFSLAGMRALCNRARSERQKAGARPSQL